MMQESLTTAQQAGLPNVNTLNVIGAFDDDEHATMAEQALEQAGFHRDDISLIAKPPGSAARVSADETKAVQGIMTGGAAGALLGGLAAVSLTIPGIGPLLAAGPIAAALGGSVLGGSLGSLIGSFVGLGMTTETAQQYEEMVRGGAEIVTVRATNTALAQAATGILETHGAHHVVALEKHL